MTVAAASGVLAMTGGYAHADAEAQATTSNSPGVLSGNSVQVPLDVPVNLCGNSVNAVALLNPAMGNGCATQSAPEHQRHAPARERHLPAPAQHTPGHGGGQHGGGQHGSAQHTGGRHEDQSGAHHGGQQGGGHASMRHDADATTAGSPGVGSGNNARVPVEAPLTVCGNTADLVGLLNPAMGNECGGKPVAGPTPPPVHHTPPPSTHVTPPPSTRVTPPTPVEHVTPPQHAAAVRPVLSQGVQLARTGSGDLGTAGAVSAGLLLSGAMLYRRTRAAQVRSN